MAKRFRDAVVAVLIGGVSFWLPDILVHAVRGERFSGGDVASLTLMLPTLSALTLHWIYRHRNPAIGKGPFALWMSLGIWVLGPISMATGASFSGGKFFQDEGWKFLGVGTLLFPAGTVIMATYDGTLGAVFLATIVLVGIAAHSFWRLRRVGVAA